jgi:hypothetical protein
VRKTILLFLLFLSVTAVRTLGQNITFSHLTTDDGLSQFSVNSLYIDERGIIWIGTREGLNRYNGNDIKSFKLKKNDPNSLFSNTVLRITGNKNGMVYLLCTDGVAEFDMTTQRFKTLLQGNVDDTTWEVALIIPYAAFFKHQIQSLDGKEIKANFYKCGDELQTPHFLSWNPIKIEKPDFHRPDFFGTLEFE